MKCNTKINEYGVCQHCWDEKLLSNFCDFANNIDPTVAMGCKTHNMHRLLKLPNGVVVPVLLLVGKGRVSMQSLSFLEASGGAELSGALKGLSGHLESDGVIRLMYVEAQPSGVVVTEIAMEDCLKNGRIVSRHLYGKDGVNVSTPVFPQEVIEF